ncbi:MAG: hypothetical protein H7838_01060 [Magnetococcus sp. DMHC-8]
MLAAGDPARITDGSIRHARAPWPATLATPAIDRLPNALEQARNRII